MTSKMRVKEIGGTLIFISKCALLRSIINSCNMMDLGVSKYKYT